MKKPISEICEPDYYYDSVTPSLRDLKFPRQNYNYGWVCPKCGAVLSPDQKCCPFCSPPMKLEVTY